MRRLVSVLLVVILCLALAVTAFATDDGFVGSIGEGGTPCDHGETKLVGKKDATCTTAGYTGDLVCDDCGEVIEEGSVIPAKGHKFVDGVCSVCGASDTPKTGDNSHIFMWVSLMAMSAAALIAVTSVRRKKA